MDMSIAVRHMGPRTAGRPSPPRTVGHSLRRIGLGVFFTSVVVNAALGIYAVLTPDFGETQERLLLSSLCATGAVLTALCCEPAWERRLLGQVPAAGALLGAVAFGALIAGIWTEPTSEPLRNILWSTFAIAIGSTLASLVVLERAREGISLAHERVLNVAIAFAALAAAVVIALVWTQPSEDTIGSFMGSGWIIVVACVLGALLTLARLAPRHQWVLKATLGLLVLATAVTIADIWIESSSLTRAMGVVLITTGAFAITVPVMHWLDRGAIAAAETTAAVRFCPHCGGKLAGEIGVELGCGRCGREFTVTPRASN
jgi:ribosomal protein S27AE